jgi:signal transduction histidine kinase
LHRHVADLQDLSHELARIERVSADELPAPIDAVRTLRELVSEMQSLSTRRAIELSVDVPDRADAVLRPSALRALLYSMLRHAIDATPRSGQVRIQLQTTENGLWITVDDSGADVPSGARDALLWRRVDPASVGRPIGPQLFVASALASHLGGVLTLEDAPGGGNRTRTWIPVL